MKNRFIISMIALVLIASFVIGCGKGNNAPAQTNNENQTSGSENPEKAQDPVTIKYYSWELKPQTKAQIEAFEKAHPLIKVDPIILVQGDVRATLEKLDVLVTAGEQVDVMRFSNQDNVLQRAATGILAPLNEYYSKDSITPEEEYYINNKLNGQYYSVMDTVSFWFIGLNESKLKDAGLSVPEMGWTWDDFREYAKKMTKGDTYGAYFHTWGDYANPIMYSERPNPYIKADLSPAFDDPSFAQYYTLRRAMEVDDKSIKPHSDVLAAKLNFANEFFNEDAAMIMYNSRLIENISDTEKFPHDFVTAFAPMPRSSKSAEIGSTYLGGEYYSIANNSNLKEQAYEFIRWMTTEGTNVAAAGLPGWKKADGKEAVKSLIGEKVNLYNVDSLMDTLYDPRISSPLDADVVVPYQSQFKKVIENGFNKFILDNATVEEAQAFMMSEAEKIIQLQKK